MIDSTRGVRFDQVHDSGGEVRGVSWASTLVRYNSNLLIGLTSDPKYSLWEASPVLAEEPGSADDDVLWVLLQHMLLTFQFCLTINAQRVGVVAFMIRRTLFAVENEVRADVQESHRKVCGNARKKHRSVGIQKSSSVRFVFGLVNSCVGSAVNNPIYFGSQKVSRDRAIVGDV